MTGHSSVRTASVALPWWAWPTALSLDAPLVSVLWQMLFARAFGHPLDWVFPTVLVLSVWLIYVADRLLDGLTLDLSVRHSYRHALYVYHRSSFGFAWLCVALGTLLLVVTQLPRQALLPGLALLAAVGLYGAGIHLLARLSVSKEMLVGLVFAVAVSLPVWLASPGGELLLATLLVALLCSLNCLLIALWEADADEAQGQASFIRTVPGVSMVLPPLLLSFSVAVLFGAIWLPMTLALSMGSSGLGLTCLSKLRGVPIEGLRVLADVALMTPLVALFFYGRGF